MTVIEERYAELVAEGLSLGEPLGPEADLYDGGRMQQYEYGRIYWHPRVGTPFACYGAILDTYLEIGAEQSEVGYPTSDETDDPDVVGGRMNTFEFGVIRWDPVEWVRVEGEEVPPEWLRSVVVKLVDEIGAPLPVGVDLDFGQLASVLDPFGAVPGVAAAVEALGGAAVRRSFGAIPAEDLAQLVARAQERDPEYRPPNLEAFVEVDCPDGVDPQAVAEVLAQIPGLVEYAYVADIPSDPLVVGTTNPRFAEQRYLEAAPTGIGVAAAWARGADGSGVSLIDIELGWFLAHEDLPRGIALLAGVNEPSSHFHGTAVLGEIVGVDNGVGVVGIAPGCTANVISWAERAGVRRRCRIAEAIGSAALRLGDGDVLLLEVQKPSVNGGVERVLPIEVERCVFEAIRLATKLGIVVVEAAGNGGLDLDQYRDARGVATLNRDLPLEFEDSGAIMVGACTPAVPHGRLPRSNYGSRVDCHAWGDRIATTGSYDTPHAGDAYWDPDKEYLPGRHGFGGTSGAAAIVAGVCVLIQHLRTLLTPLGAPGRLDAARMRFLLQDVENGTDTFLVSDKIGPMPDLERIIAREFAA
ncbi:MAG TPA: S8 family serine peptidase [Solirubrobacteraceae bacterium]|nr:S8 family serine peptidase [Solirubrobacteraceae bacterium]